MKKLISILSLLLIFSAFANAQHNYTVKIYNTDMKAMAGITVTGICQETGKSLSSITDVKGVASFVLDDTGTWKFSYLEMKDFATYKVAPNSYGEGSKTTTYDPQKQFITPAKQNRQGVNFKTVNGLNLKSK